MAEDKELDGVGPPPGTTNRKRCPLLCHRGLHQCLDQAGHDHACPPCGVELQLASTCPHTMTMFCNEREERMECSKLVLKQRSCGHLEEARCSDSLEMIELFPCEATVKTMMECGHGVIYTVCCEGPPIGYQCSKEIASQRSCGHFASVFCKDGFGNPRVYPCKSSCLRKCPRGHQCPGVCGEPCSPCLRSVTLRLSCGKHDVTFTCSTQPSDWKPKCKEICGAQLKGCDHKCTKKCHKDKSRCGNCCKKVKLTVEGCEEPDHRSIVFCYQKQLLESTNKKGLCQFKVPFGELGICGHELRVPCYLQKLNPPKDQLLKYCSQPCNILMVCGHFCKGNCRDCHQGKFHVRCSEPCGKTLICGHSCESTCNSVCPPCPKPCDRRCKHGRCRELCGFPCIPCAESISYCELECDHHVGCARKLCVMPCTVPQCEQPCPYILSCGHYCISLCGERCPKLCRVCNRETLLDGMFDGSTEIEPDHRFLELPCGHCIEYESLKHFLQAEPEGGELVRKCCPLCRKGIFKLPRFFNIIEDNDRQMRRVAMRIFSDNPAHLLISKAGTLFRRYSKRPKYPTHFTSSGANYDVLIRSLINRIDLQGDGNGIQVTAGVVNRVEELMNWFIKQEETLFGYIRQRAVEARVLREVIDEVLTWVTAQEFPLKAQQVEDLNRAFVRVRDVESIVSRTVRYPSDGRRRIHATTSAEGLVAFQLAFDAARVHAAYTPENQDRFLAFRTALDETIGHRLGVTEEETRLIVQAIGGPAGHWFRCPKGHPYVITECGGAMVLGKCNECGADIGGTHHQSLLGNTLASEMDGAEAPAWPTAFNRVDLEPQGRRNREPEVDLDLVLPRAYVPPPPEVDLDLVLPRAYVPPPPEVDLDLVLPRAYVPPPPEVDLDLVLPRAYVPPPPAPEAGMNLVFPRAYVPPPQEIAEDENEDYDVNAGLN